MYGYNNHILTADELLERINQEEIFEKIFKTEIIMIKKIYKSPMRKDNEGKCFFDEYQGVLQFIDYGNPMKTHYNCIDVVRALSNVSEGEAIRIISEKLDINVSSPIINSIQSKNIYSYNKVVVPYRRDFNRRDLKFWSKSLIYENQLEEDNVFPISHYELITEMSTKRINCYQSSYAITFKNGHVKIYNPFSKDRAFRFIGTMDNNDIGNIDNIDEVGDTLIITKSYKDHRVFKNILNTNNVIWFHNEGCIPDNVELLKQLLQKFKKIIVFYDNDEAGIIAGEKITNYLLSLDIHKNIFSKSIPKKYKETKDVSDFIYVNGRLDTLKLLKKLKI